MIFATRAFLSEIYTASLSKSLRRRYSAVDSKYGVLASLAAMLQEMVRLLRDARKGNGRLHVHGMVSIVVCTFIDVFGQSSCSSFTTCYCDYTVSLCLILLLLPTYTTHALWLDRAPHPFPTLKNQMQAPLFFVTPLTTQVYVVSTPRYHLNNPPISLPTHPIHRWETAVL